MIGTKQLTNKEIEQVVNELDNNRQDSVNDYSILLIDDDKWIHRVICHYLKNWGFNPISAFDPVDGLAMAVKHRPVLILLDIYMSELKGDILLKMLKKIEYTSNIPIIIISGNLNTELFGVTYRNGAFDYISKPIQESVLFEKIIAAITPEKLSAHARYSNIRA